VREVRVYIDEKMKESANDIVKFFSEFDDEKLYNFYLDHLNCTNNEQLLKKYSIPTEPCLEELLVRAKEKYTISLHKNNKSKSINRVLFHIEESKNKMIYIKRAEIKKYLNIHEGRKLKFTVEHCANSENCFVLRLTDIEK